MVGSSDRKVKSLIFTQAKKNEKISSKAFQLTSSNENTDYNKHGHQ